MTSIQRKRQQLQKDRRNAAIAGAVLGSLVGFALSFDWKTTLFCGVVTSLILFYVTSIVYWEYEASLRLPRRNRK